MEIVKYLARTAQIDIKDCLGVSVRGFIAEWRLGVDFLYSLTKHSRKATIYAKSLNQCCRNCSGCSGFAIGYSALSSFQQSCVQLYTCTCVHFCLNYTVKTQLVQRPYYGANEHWPLLEATKSWVVSSDDNKFMILLIYPQNLDSSEGLKTRLTILILSPNAKLRSGCNNSQNFDQ